MCRDEDPTATSLTLLRRRAQALVVFVGHALKALTNSSTSTEGEMTKLVAALLALATLQTGLNSERKVDEICQAARASLNKALSVMAASDFINGVLSMLASGDKLVRLCSVLCLAFKD